jgi:hypothetical protein
VAIAGSSQQSAEKKACEYKVDRPYGDYKALIADPDIQVIHNTTPNHLHSIEHEDSLLSPGEGLARATHFLSAIILKEKPAVAGWV